MKLKVTQKENAPEILTEVTAQAIQEISAALKRMRGGRLKEKALIILIKRAAPSWVTEVQVRAVLEGISNLEKEYLNK